MVNKNFLNGIAMGLIGKGEPTFNSTNNFSTGYVLGAELRKERSNPAPVFGVEWDYSQSSTKLTRTHDAVAFADPAPATSLTETGTSPFDNLMPWYGMKRVTIGTDEMVYIPKFYYRAEDDPSNSKMRWQITYAPKEGFALHPGSGRYIARYHTSTGYASVSGARPIGGLTVDIFRINSHAKGDKWWMLDMATWSAVQYLYLIEYADWDSQTVLGRGQITNGIVNTGGTDTAKYHTIKAEATSHQYRWIEDPFSNIRSFANGCICNTDLSVWVGTNNEDFDYSTNGLVNTGVKLPNGNGYATKLGLSEVAPWLFIPTELGGGAGIYLSDYSMGKTGVSALTVGGSNSTDDRYGMFMFDANDSITFTASDAGSRLIYIP